MATHGNRRAPLVVEVASGQAELRPDRARPQGWTLLVNGVPQSYVDLADPERLEFGYVRQIGRALRAWSASGGTASGGTASGVPDRILHLGGGALTVPRLAARWWPGVAQKVVELDPLLVDLVRRELPPPGGVEIEVGDARVVLEAEDPRGYDVIVADVFDGAATPVSVATLGFASAAARALRPGGLLIMNVTDVPPLAWTRIQVATVRAAFGQAGLLGPAAVLRGRRAGNVVLLAGAVPRVPTERDERLLRAGELVVFSGGARPRLDAPR
ncbi:fused MFS/spermidine synthase [Actinoplanes missouriensis]|uniref:spermidine synthase n=1 Tax=Actinoplanes missouriensis TaxID=1866 RepID=UPI0033E00E5C